MSIAPRATTFTSPEPYVVSPSQEFDGNDGAWSTFKISVGTPGQDFRVLVSTKSGETYVVVPEGCIEGIDGPNCSKLRGVERFQSSQSPGFQVNMSSSWSTLGQYSVDLEGRLNYTAQGLFGFDEVSLGSAVDKSALSLDHQVVAGIADLDYYIGYIPLGVPESSFSSLSESIDSFIYQLRNATKIPSLSFSYTAGAEYKLRSVFGSLILGGYDATRFTPNAQDFSFSFANDPSRLLTVGVESIMAMNTLKGTYSLSSGAHFSLIDSTVPHLWLPQYICDNFEQAFGLTYDPRTDFYLVNNTIHRKLKSLNPSITIKLVNSLEDTSTNYTNIILPYAAFDLQASYPYYENATNYFPIRRAANDTQYVLGRTLLQEAYLIVDYERANFSISQAAFPDPLPAAKIFTIEPPSSSSSSSSSRSGKKSLGTGAIAGIAAAGAILLLLVLIGAFFVWRKRRGVRKRKYELANTQISETGSWTNISSTAFKNQGPQELGGTPLTELASPRDGHFNSEQKTFLSPTTVAQELPTPMTPSRGQQRWREVTAHEMEGSSPPSRAPSEDGTGRQASTGISPSTAISPLTERL
jgi:hypothetical protein